MVKLYQHQKEAMTKIRELDGRAGVFVDVGGGKTVIALSWMRWRGVRRLLVVLPGYVVPVWEENIDDVVQWDMPILDLTVESVAARTDSLARFGNGVVLVNYEAYWREPLRAQILKWKAEGAVFDEVQRIRGRGARQSKFAGTFSGSLNNMIPNRLALSATPMTNGLQDAWGIFRFINPQMFGNWRQFEQDYLTYGGFEMRAIVGYRNEERAEKLIAANSFQWVGDLPPAPDIPIYVTLKPSTKRIYNDMAKHAIAEVVSSGAVHVALARLAMVKQMRLTQITSGFIRDEDTKEEVDVGDEKLSATTELLEDLVSARKRVVVFCRFTHDVNRLVATFAGRHWRVGTIMGGISQKERKRITQGFDDGHFDVLVCQIKASSLGISLASAEVGVFYSVGPSLDDFVQAKGRMTGVLRQRHDVVFYHVMVRGSVDEKNYKNLSTKKSSVERLTILRYALDMLAELT